MSLKIIILAGGKGSRIKSVLNNTPKILAPIAGKNFLDWLLVWIDSWNLNVKTEILLSTCIGHKIIQKYCKENELNLKCVPETRPLGTFGALANVVSKNISEKYLVLNGDTIFKANFQNIYQSYINHKINKPLIILKKSKEKSRYGGYKKNKEGWTFSNENTSFISLGSFFISYSEIKKRWTNASNKPFENKYINNYEKILMIDKNLFGIDPISAQVLPHETPFIDIGIPSSYKEAQHFIPKIL